MQSLPDDHIDLTVTSPPYDNLRSYKGVGDEWNFETFKPIARELFRVTKKGGVVVWVVGDATIEGSETGTSFRQALYFMECGFRLHDTMIYQRNMRPLTHNRYEQNFEYMFVFSKRKPKIFNPITITCRWAGKTRHLKTNSRQDGDKLNRRWKIKPIAAKRIKENIWYYATGFGCTTKDKEAFEHPAVFPEKLAQDHIISWSNEGDLVFDPFMGSGTVGKQCELLRRRWLGCDKVESYCSIAAKRIEAAANQKTFEDYL
jgi:site-specific DNA-methyltransferase (adenine-specific)